MKSLDLDKRFLDRLKEIRYKYEEKIPEGFKFYYKKILDGEDLDLYMQMYSLSKEDLLKCAKICKIIDIYEQIIELTELAKEEAEGLGLYQDFVEELQAEGEDYLEEFNEKEEQETVVNSGNTNLIIYTSYIDESKERTLYSRSGKEEQAQKSVANIIEQLVKVDYHELRKKGCIHQNVQTDNNKKPCYVGGAAFERIGSITTKVNYIRIPITMANRENLKRTLNTDFDTLYLVTNYGDFQNEGIDENQYYIDSYSGLKKHLNEILIIMDIFGNDFTVDNFPIAINLINNGLRTTNELTSIIRNRQL